MPKYEYDIGIIGGGAAGLTVASGAARLGASTLLVEKEPQLGGDCLHFGCVPSKTLIKTARVYHQMGNAHRYGLPEFTRPPVNFCDIAARIKMVIGVIQQHDSKERFSGLGVKVVCGAPRFTDEHSVDLGGKQFTARKWVIATGSSPAIPMIPGLSETPYLTNRELFTLEQLPESLLILGAGPIAIEMAQAFRRLGSKVTVIQRGSQILSKEDQDLADLVMATMIEEGVNFYLGSRILSIQTQGKLRQVMIETAAGQKITLTGTDILVTLGREANSANLGLDRLGISGDVNGIKVDKRLRTAQANIFAAGDVIGDYQYTHAAGYEGGIVISNAIFHLPRQVDYRWMPRCTYTDPEIASIGYNEKSAQGAGLEYRVWREEFKDNDRSLAEGNVTGQIKLLLGRGDRPLGVQIFGPHAGEIMAEWVAVLNSGIKLSGLAGAIHPYPTFSEINKKVVGSVFAEKIFSNRVRKYLKLLFNLTGHSN
ncbi:MAG: FAD-dependent oxidoreductase [Desulfobulbaceae bacterium]|nr:FAD-dependent oxidoreductase [Desulfobulbaceae bacterium]